MFSNSMPYALCLTVYIDVKAYWASACIMCACAGWVPSQCLYMDIWLRARAFVGTYLRCLFLLLFLLICFSMLPSLISSQWATPPHDVSLPQTIGRQVIVKGVSSHHHSSPSTTNEKEGASRPNICAGCGETGQFKKNWSKGMFQNSARKEIRTSTVRCFDQYLLTRTSLNVPHLISFFLTVIGHWRGRHNDDYCY